MKFTINHTDKNSKARTGKISTTHGDIHTPCFMPVGTQASVKALTSALIKEQGAEIILANTYHLFLRPGHEIIKALGGLHKFMAWDRPILTDSGGFQVYSLSAIRDISEAGVSFQSHIDGTRKFLSPEIAIEIQEALGVDIMMCFDECTPYPASFEEAKKSLELTLRWAKRCKDAKSESDNALFGIVQGGMYQELRKQSLDALADIGFDGYALGGVSVGEPKEMMQEIVASCAPLLPADKPRYLMGVGFPDDIIHAVTNGIDMFDCVIPTRCARNGLLFTNGKNIVIGNAVYAQDGSAIDEQCDCYVCKNYSRAYLRHLYVADEILAMILGTIHNVRYYMRLMEKIREAIANDCFKQFCNDWKYSLK
ncbi:MAG: tRNA guanosine(34) transglycosylase Tgt [Deltaproteobacteria bacterium]